MTIEQISGLRLPMRLALAMALGAVTAAARAEDPAAGSPKPPEPPKAASCPARCIARGSSVDSLARAIAAGLGRVPDGAVVRITSLTSDEQTRRPEALVALLAEQVAGRLGPGIGVEPAPLGRDEARRAAKAPGIVVLEPRIEAGRLRLSADAYPVPTSVWAKARAQTLPGPIAHAHAVAVIDAEIRSYLAPLGLGDAKVSKLKGADPEIKALACGDLDGDGESDVVTMNRQRVLRVRLAGDTVERLREARWDDLAPIAPVPLREPIGFATIAESGLDLMLSDRRGSLRLDADLQKIEELRGKAVPHGRGSACTFFEDLRLLETLAPCSEGDPKPSYDNLRHRSDAIASTILVTPQGEARTIVALRKDGTLVVRDGERDSFIARVGAQLAVGDLDQDGALDLVSTIDTLAPKLDAVEIRSLDPTGTVKVRQKVPVPSGVEAVAICPPDQAGRPAPILVATAGEIWILR